MKFIYRSVINIYQHKTNTCPLTAYQHLYLLAIFVRADRILRRPSPFPIFIFSLSFFSSLDPLAPSSCNQHSAGACCTTQA